MEMTACIHTRLCLPVPSLPRRGHLSPHRASVRSHHLPFLLSPSRSDSLRTTQQPTYLQATPSGQDAVSKDVHLLSPSGQKTQITKVCPPQPLSHTKHDTESVPHWDLIQCRPHRPRDQRLGSHSSEQRAFDRCFCYLVLDEHIRIDVKNAQVRVTALGGNPDDIASETYTEMNNNPLRSGVAYLAPSGARLQIGSDENEAWTIVFEEQSNMNPLNEALMKSMLAGFSPEAKDAFKQNYDL